MTAIDIKENVRIFPSLSDKWSWFPSSDIKELVELTSGDGILLTRSSSSIICSNEMTNKMTAIKVSNVTNWKNWENFISKTRL